MEVTTFLGILFIAVTQIVRKTKRKVMTISKFHERATFDWFTTASPAVNPVTSANDLPRSHVALACLGPQWLSCNIGL